MFCQPVSPPTLLASDNCSSDNAQLSHYHVDQVALGGLPYTGRSPAVLLNDHIKQVTAQHNRFARSKSHQNTQTVPMAGGITQPVCRPSVTTRPAAEADSQSATIARNSPFSTINALANRPAPPPSVRIAVTTLFNNGNPARQNLFAAIVRGRGRVCVAHRVVWAECKVAVRKSAPRIITLGLSATTNSQVSSSR